MTHSHDKLFCRPLVHDQEAISDASRPFSRRNRWGKKPHGGVNRRYRRRAPLILLLAWPLLELVLSGCTKSIVQPTTATSGPFEATPSVVAFGAVQVGHTSASSVSLINQGTAPVQITNVSISGQSFSVSGAGDLPIAVAAGATFNLSVIFAPTAVGSASGQLSITNNSATDGQITVSLSGTGATASVPTLNAPTLSGLSCASSSFTGPATDSCAVTLSSAAGSGGISVGLASNDSAVTVPTAVTVASGASSASFTATVAAVTTATTVTLTASANGASQTFVLTLGAAVPTLGVSASSLAFGDVNLNSPATQSLTLTSTGTAAVTVNGVTVSGAGFSVSGATSSQTLTPGQTATLNVEFDPTTAGAVTGSLTISSNSSTGSSTVVSLTGTGVSSSTAYEVQLNWDAPSSSTDPVNGYNVYRAPSGSTSYQQLNTSTLPLNPTSYTDNNNIEDGQTYDYIVESVDAEGNTSAPSNIASATIP